MNENSATTTTVEVVSHPYDNGYGSEAHKPGCADIKRTAPRKYTSAYVVDVYEVATRDDLLIKLGYDCLADEQTDAEQGTDEWRKELRYAASDDMGTKFMGCLSHVPQA